MQQKCKAKRLPGARARILAAEVLGGECPPVFRGSGGAPQDSAVSGVAQFIPSTVSPYGSMGPPAASMPRLNPPRASGKKCVGPQRVKGNTASRIQGYFLKTASILQGRMATIASILQGSLAKSRTNPLRVNAQRCFNLYR